MSTRLQRFLSVYLRAGLKILGSASAMIPRGGSHHLGRGRSACSAVLPDLWTGTSTSSSGTSRCAVSPAVGAAGVSSDEQHGSVFGSGFSAPACTRGRSAGPLATLFLRRSRLSRPPLYPTPPFGISSSSLLRRGFSSTGAPAAPSNDPLSKDENPASSKTKNKEDLTAAVPLPTSIQLRGVFIASAIPFVGFGFLDNFLMILAGDAIDATLCVAFGFSTMAAAALGNTISDIAGVFSGGVVEDWARKMGIEMPPLSHEQRTLFPVKMYQYTGQAIGIVVGCLVGMCPLLWIDPNAIEKRKKEAQKREMFQSVCSDVSDLLNAEATSMMLLDTATNELYTEATDTFPEFRSKLEEGIMGHCATTGKFVNIKDLETSELFDPVRHRNYRGTGIDIRSVICMPVLNLVGTDTAKKTGKSSDSPVLAVVEVVMS